MSRHLGLKVYFENKRNPWGTYRITYHISNYYILIVLCFVITQLESGYST